MTDPSRSAFAVTIRRPVAILMVTVATVVFGIFSYRLLPIELMPDITYPSLTVRTQYAGAAPEEVEENVTRPVEEALGVVGGLVRLSSISRAELSDVTLEFTWGTSMGAAWQEVTERLDTVFLPEDANKPLILRYDPSLDPVLRLALASTRDDDQGPAGLKRLRTYAEQDLRRRLEQIEGVAAVRVLGGLEEQVSVELQEEALRRTGLSIHEVGRRLQVENVNLAGGDIKEGDTQYLVRTVNEFKSLPEIADLVVARIGDRDIRLGDIGIVRSGWADREVITRFEGSEAIEVEIQKEADANMVAMAANVRAAVEGVPADGKTAAKKGLVDSLPTGWTLQVISDRSTFIRAAVQEVKNAAIVGGLLAVFVLYLFLRDFRATSVISVAIPISVAATFAPMNLSGVTLNLMSLGGLALGIGMLVDSAIVVVESIARCREEGDSTDGAVVRGTSEVGSAVVASVLTTVAVFAPMAFVVGVAGQVFADLALTVVYSLIASLLVALFLVPALSARVGRRGEGPGDRVGIVERLRRVLRYRALGPLSASDVGRIGRGVGYVLLSVPLLAVAWFFTRGKIPQLAGVLALVAAALIAIATLYNVVDRIRTARSLAGYLGALALFAIDPVVVALEALWLVLVWAVVLVVGPLWGLLWLAGRALGLVLRPIVAAVNVALSWLQEGYPRLIRAALRQRVAVIAVAVVCMVLTVLGFTTLDSSLIPDVHQGEFDLEIALPVGTPLEETLRAVAPLEEAALDDPRVDRVLLKIGADPDADSGPEEGEHTARLTVHLVAESPARGLVGRIGRLVREAGQGLVNARHGGLMAVREEVVADDLRRVLATLPEVQSKLSRPVLFSFRTPIEVEVEAYDLDELRMLGDRAEREMESIAGLTDVKSSARPGSPEVQIVYDREALIRLGLDLRSVADLVRTKVQGSSATEYRKRERRIDVVVRLAEQDRATLRQLRNLVVNPGAEVPVPLSAIAEVTVSTGPADIRRAGQRRVSLVSANVQGRGLSGVSDEIGERLDALVWPDGTSWSLSGQAQEMERSLRSLWIALAISIFLVYVVMASQFESIVHPLLIMITVPLALAGVVALLHALAISLSVVVFLGMIMLAGIVVNNAIVFVDYVNTLRGRGMTIEDALVEAGRVRLRPILMTTSTTVLALLPMALGLGDGAEIRTPMALCVIAGLLTSTVLTLIILPTVYAVAESGMAALRPGRTGRPVSSPEPALDR
jgi:HAE1 family hydrophobic/amphiphilic exporter-1